MKIAAITTFAGYQEAVATLTRWAEAYYNGGDAFALDSEYDALYREVMVYEAKHPEHLIETSPTQHVGAKVLDGFEKRNHNHPMLSLKDAFEEAEIAKWAQLLSKGEGDVWFLCEPKYDGASLNLQYVDGRLDAAITRGDGETGEDVSETIKSGAVKGIPLELPAGFPALCEVRGEVLMTYSAFEKNNEARLAAGKNEFSNPRNAASGSLRQLEVAEVARRGLIFIPYDIKTDVLDTQSQIGKLLDSDCFVKGAGRMLVKNADGLAEAYRDFNALRNSLPYPLDGMVAKVDSKPLQEKLGYATKHPKWALACKFEPEEVTTTVLDVVVQVGKNGAQTPVAILEPTEIAGTVVERATLNNFAHITAKDIRVGDKCNLIKSGDIIPMITRSFADRRTGAEKIIEAPTHCVHCGSPLER